MDFFLWNLIWVTWGNISILRGTPGFHCAYTLLLLNCKCFDLKGHSQGKACLHESHWAHFHLAGKKPGSCWAEQSHLRQPLEDGHSEHGLMSDAGFSASRIAVSRGGQGKSLAIISSKADSWRELPPTSLGSKEHPAPISAIPIPRFLWMRLFENAWVWVKWWVYGVNWVKPSRHQNWLKIACFFFFFF